MHEAIPIKLDEEHETQPQILALALQGAWEEGEIVSALIKTDEDGRFLKVEIYVGVKTFWVIAHSPMLKAAACFAQYFLAPPGEENTVIMHNLAFNPTKAWAMQNNVKEAIKTLCWRSPAVGHRIMDAAKKDGD